jgi:hypothetical protein
MPKLFGEWVAISLGFLGGFHNLAYSGPNRPPIRVQVGHSSGAFRPPLFLGLSWSE